MNRQALVVVNCDKHHEVKEHVLLHESVGREWHWRISTRLSCKAPLKGIDF